MPMPPNPRTTHGPGLTVDAARKTSRFGGKFPFRPAFGRSHASGVFSSAPIMDAAEKARIMDHSSGVCVFALKIRAPYPIRLLKGRMK